ncbi:MAG: TatD family hydrolase [Leeuwenhoekiella sp.]
MHLIDTHTHLYSEAFDEDRDSVIHLAFQSGVQHFFLPAIDSQYTPGMLNLKDRYPENMHLMAGLHPTHVKEATVEAELQHVLESLNSKKYVAVGEIGIDLYWDKSTLRIQQLAFKRQIALAKAFDLPIVIHCRDAFDEVFEILEEEKENRLRGIFHCFTGTEAQAKQAIDLNMRVGIGGVVTFKNGKIDQFLERIDLKHIVLETDAPYLAPKPFRGKRNSSEYLSLVAQKIAEIHQLTLEEVALQTTKNALEIFNMTEKILIPNPQSNPS